MWRLVVKHKLAASAVAGALALALLDWHRRKRNSGKDPGSRIDIDVSDAFGRHAGAADPDAFDW